MKIIKIELLTDILKSKQKISSVEEIGTSETTGAKGVNKAEKVTLNDGTSWIIKPRFGEHISRWRHVPPKSLFRRERASYLTDKQLRFNLVPLTKVIKYNGDLASSQRWIENAEDSDITLDKYHLDYIWMAGLEDILVGQTDRHRHNWLGIGNKPILIDSGFSFPISASENDPRSIILSRFACKIWGKKIPQKFLERIKRLGDVKFQSGIKNLLEPEALELFFKRVDELLDTGVARVNGYKAMEKLRGIPGRK